MIIRIIHKEKCKTLFIILFVVITNLNIMIPSISAEMSRIIHVDDDGGEDYTSIQDAIDNAIAGDTIYVFSGYYHENISIDKSLTLVGENRSDTFIDAGEVGHAVRISADNVTLKGFNISNNGNFRASIFIDNGNSCMISDNYISNAFNDGIRLYFSDNNTVANNIINGHNGISVGWFSCNNSLISNQIINISNHGICITDWSNDNIVEGNVIISEWDCGILICFDVTNCIVINNIIKDSYEQGMFLHTRVYNTTIEENVITNNGGMGILIDLWCKYTNISGNIIVDNNVRRYNDAGGIGIGSSSYTTIIGNEIRNNTGEEIDLYESSHTTVERNNIFIKKLFRDGEIHFQVDSEDTVEGVWNTYHKIKTNCFYHNYWGRLRIFPKVISGKIGYRYSSNPFVSPIKIPVVLFDVRPALQPFDISLGVEM